MADAKEAHIHKLFVTPLMKMPTFLRPTLRQPNEEGQGQGARFVGTSYTKSHTFDTMGGAARCNRAHILDNPQSEFS